MTKPYAEPERGLLLVATWPVVEAAFFVLDHDPDRRHRVATGQWACEMGIDEGRHERRGNGAT